MSSINQWIVAHVKSKAERSVADLLGYKGYDVFLPMYNPQRSSGGWAAVTRGVGEIPLFPGYVFCRLVEPANALVVTTPGVIRILGTRGRPTPVDDHEIESLKVLVRADLPLRPWPQLADGDLLEIVDGPLRGCRGVFRTWNGHGELIVSVVLLQRSVMVPLEPDWVVPVMRKRPVVSAASGLNISQSVG